MASNTPGSASDFAKKGEYYRKRGNTNMAESWNNTAKMARNLDVDDMKKGAEEAKSRQIDRAAKAAFAFR